MNPCGCNSMNNSGLKHHTLWETDTFRYGGRSALFTDTARSLFITNIQLHLLCAFEQNKIVLSLLCGALQLKQACYSLKVNYSHVRLFQRSPLLTSFKQSAINIFVFPCEFYPNLPFYSPRINTNI
jgi:hypothetical protein